MKVLYCPSQLHPAAFHSLSLTRFGRLPPPASNPPFVKTPSRSPAPCPRSGGTAPPASAPRRRAPAVNGHNRRRAAMTGRGGAAAGRRGGASPFLLPPRGPAALREGGWALGPAGGIRYRGACRDRAAGDAAGLRGWRRGAARRALPPSAVVSRPAARKMLDVKGWAEYVVEWAARDPYGFLTTVILALTPLFIISAALSWKLAKMIEAREREQKKKQKRQENIAKAKRAKRD
ncbi:Small integral membrane protein 15 [Aix galericulata]|nr:Small integral membrane protein 15 [Aix galericulata]